MSCQQTNCIFFVLNTPPMRNRTFFTTQFKPYRFLRLVKCCFCDRGLQNLQLQVVCLKLLDVCFLLWAPLICSSFLSSGGILRDWKRVKVDFLWQGSSKQTSPISHIFLLGSARIFFATKIWLKKRPQTFPDASKRVFLRIKHVPRRSEHVFSHTKHVPTASQTLPADPRRLRIRIFTRNGEESLGIARNH